jgi:hypothetical protein
MGTVRGLLAGAAAGAAGTTALNLLSYLDMTVRGRGASSTPEDTVKKLADVIHVNVPGEGDTRDNRLSSLGALTGIASGIGVGAALGLARGLGWRPGPLLSGITATLGALLGTNGPMTALGVTDPRTWPLDSWVSDLVPHLGYGAVTAGVLTGLDP